jgi:sulfur carrier protein
MRVIINGEARDLESSNLESLLLECGYQDKPIATALNGEFIHRHLRVETILREDDRVEIVSPIEGG